MVIMKKLLSGFLMLVVLTPSLACGGMMCAKKAHAAQGRPCHEKQENGKNHAVMLFTDCLGVDLAQADQADTLKKPDVHIKKVVYAWVAIVTDYDFMPSSSYQIRGPPPAAVTARIDPPLYLTTQRLRI